jgi:hybrid polyketide synthase/nonribosomal peptide synthetase ACE1
VVLEDVVIRDMSLEALLKVTRPKVDGSLHLEELFQVQDSDLDFFIFFSSVGSVSGRPG